MVIEKRRVFLNALWSVFQVLGLAAVLFVLYRFLLRTLGAEQIGIWSVVLATTSISRIADLGLSSSVVKFVAKYSAHRDHERVSEVVQTAAISIALLIGFTISVFYPFATWVIGQVVPPANVGEAVAILPYSLLSLWLATVAGVFHGGLDGYQRIDLRSILVLGASVVNLLLCLLLAPTLGLIGVAYAQVLQSIMAIIGGWLLLKRQLKILPVIPIRWDASRFKELVRYGINFQIVSVTTMLCDPTTKGLLSRFGGLAMVAYFEMASRMVTQIRALIVSANQVLVPAIAEMKERNPSAIQTIYQDSYRLLLYLSVPLFIAIILLAPLVSEVWIGHYETLFVLFSMLLGIGWLINTLSSSAYFVNLGTGDLRWNTIGNVLIGVLNATIGLALGMFLGGKAVVVAWVFSLAFGSILIAVFYHRKHGIPISAFVPKESALILVTSFFSFSVALSFYSFANGSRPATVANFLVVAFLILLGTSMWIHPMRKRLGGWITVTFLNR